MKDVYLFFIRSNVILETAGKISAFTMIRKKSASRHFAWARIYSPTVSLIHSDFSMKYFFSGLALLSVSLLFLISCESQTQKEERLAHQYCSSCHLFPEPS